MTDFAITNQADDTMTVFMARKDPGQFRFTPTTLPTGPSPSQLVIGHLNGRDGANDIAVANLFGGGPTLFTNSTG